MMKIYKTLLALLLVMVIVVILTLSGKKTENVSGKGLDWYKKESNNFVLTAIHLKSVLNNINDKDSSTITKAKEAFKKCRLQYKRISFFIGYYFPEENVICNGPPVQEVESPDEFKEPAGLQVIESLLFVKDAYLNKQKLIIQTDLLIRTVESSFPLLEGFKMTDDDLLASLNIELTRIITLYITGYDAPQIKTGIEEAYVSLSTINVLLNPYIKNYTQKDSIKYYLTAGEKYLKAHPDFDSFDRLCFITSYALPIEMHLTSLITQGGFAQSDATTAYNIYSKNLFAPDAINKKDFPHTEDENNALLSQLGKQLFFEPALSGNHTRTCATCHSPNASFTDRLARNRSMDGTADLPRNTPGLLYACYQYTQFWDGRAESLEDQIKTVLKSKQEMNVLEDSVMQRLSHDSVYVRKFKKVWLKSNAVSFAHIAGALAAFVRTLTPFRSAFDHYIQGDHTALSVSQQRGFNLFMGKAQCGSCHFAPVFNGLLPPDYKTTEFEILGTTADDDLDRPRADSDRGRYNFKSLPLNKGAFKTPSVRNAAVTAPYMHNGRFKSLEKVIDFYDRGGGSGLGLNIPEQTLSSLPLHLNTQEKKDIVAFIGSLTDK